MWGSSQTNTDQNIIVWVQDVANFRSDFGSLKLRSRVELDGSKVALWRQNFWKNFFDSLIKAGKRLEDSGILKTVWLMIWWDTKVELLLKTHRKTENCLREFGRSHRRGRLNTRSAFNSVQQNLLVVSVHEYELYVNLFQLFSDSTGDLAVELLERPNEILIFKRELLWT